MNANNDSCVDYDTGPVVNLTGAEIAFLQGGLNCLNGNISADVTSAQTADTHLNVSLVDLSTIMVGHEWYTSDPWAYGPSIDNGEFVTGGILNPAPFHPTPEGQHAIAAAVMAKLP
jgi:hypothetical protein